jgi:hypothetical protein
LGADPLPTSEDDEWRFVFAPYLWGLSVDGYTNIKGNDARIDESFGDILDMLSLVLEGRFEAWKGDWGTMIDLTYAQLENDADILVGPIPIEVEVKTDMAMVFGGALHRLVEQKVNEDGSGGINVDLFMGVAYTAIDTEIDFSTGLDVDGSESILDPLAGLRTRWMFSKNWGASVEMDIGGFGLFNGSDLVTLATLMIGRKFGDDKFLYIGWRNMDIEYDQHDVELDVTFNGPILGFEWHF